LQLLGQRVGVADKERRRETLGEVERIRRIDHHLAVDRFTRSLQRRQRTAAVRSVDEHIGIKILVRCERQVDSSPLLPFFGLIGITRTDSDLVTGGVERLTECRSDRAGSENGNLHRHIIYRVVSVGGCHSDHRR
jgi:hypothetical protein